MLAPAECADSPQIRKISLSLNRLRHFQSTLPLLERPIVARGRRVHVQESMLEIVKEQLSFFPTLRRHAEFVLPFILAAHPTKYAMEEITRLLPLFTEEYRIEFLERFALPYLRMRRYDYAPLLQDAREISLLLKSESSYQPPIQNPTNTITFSARYEFFANGILPLLVHNRAMDFLAVRKIFSLIKEEKLKGSNFLPQSVLSEFGCNFEDACYKSKPFFMKAFAAGMLVEATAPIDGCQRTVYVKGFWSDAGHHLAYDPVTNCVYKIRMRKGKITKTELAYDYNTHPRQKGTELQDLFKNLQP